MRKSFEKLVDASWFDRSAAEIASASTSALRGVSTEHAAKLVSLGIDTVGALASSRMVAAARAVVAGAGDPMFDPGPPKAWAELFAAAPLDAYRTHASGRFRIDFGPVYYRGRLDSTARVFIVGQDPSSDELLGHRILVGDAGQRIQRLLDKLGVKRSYVMLNTFLFGVFGQFDGELEHISLEPTIVNYRNRLFDRVVDDNPLEAVIAIGRGARHAVEHWPASAALTVVEIAHPSAPDATVRDSWNAALPALATAISVDSGATRDLSPYPAVFGADAQIPIPRFDLPFGVPDWHGTGGTRSQRDGNQKIVWRAG